MTSASPAGLQMAALTMRAHLERIESLVGELLTSAGELTATLTANRHAANMPMPAVQRVVDCVGETMTAAFAATRGASALHRHLDALRIEAGLPPMGFGDEEDCQLPKFTGADVSVVRLAA